MLRSLTALVIIGGAGAILATAGVLALSWWQPSSQYSTDLWLNQGWSLTINTIALATTVLGGTWFLGGLLATLTTFVNFKGKALALMLALAPLTIPSYVLGFIWLSWFDYTGPLQKALRWWDHDHTLDLIGNGFAGLALSMIFSLFPYVFIIVRVRLNSLDGHLIEASRSLGRSRWATLREVIVPLLLPAFLSSGFLVLMEVISDFGTVMVFSYPTLTTAIFKSWYGFFDLAGALQLASILWILCWLVYGSSRGLRHKGKALQHHCASLGEQYQKIPTPQLSSRLHALAQLGVWLTLTLTTVLPLLTLAYLAVSEPPPQLTDLLLALAQSLTLAISVTIITVMISIITLKLLRSVRTCPCPWKGSLSCALRHRIRSLTPPIIRLLNMGYAFPGAVFAVAIYMIATLLINYLPISVGLMSTPVFLIIAMTLYILAVGYRPLAEGFDKIPRELDESSQLSGVGGWRLWRRVHAPLLHYPLILSGLIVFLDVLKEMPLTLMLRPVHWSPLTVQIFDYTSEGEWSKAAAPALMIVTLSMIILAFFLRRETNGASGPWIRHLKNHPYAQGQPLATNWVHVQSHTQHLGPSHRPGTCP